MLGVYNIQPSIIIRQMSMQDLPANVGIGTIEPKQQLHIKGNTLISRTNKSFYLQTHRLLKENSVFNIMMMD